MMNSKIPKGRSMIKWQAFAALPEQFIGICDLDHNLAKTAKLWFFLCVANLLFKKDYIISRYYILLQLINQKN
ncbi:hypothetical protein PDL05_21920 [Bacillus cereus group sp. BY112LC]|uniref:hypothetical protein n=1 Tax=Bacillus cereus group sp. BY112LC TaxID=3018086 RepID=UPI0022DF370F|nr:hypothetical protein [Bacillus cereus group sp. BY112LC]MDA1876386.1 hypothetical protein [Bacillus cereus group sp. BY112LC]